MKTRRATTKTNATKKVTRLANKIGTRAGKKTKTNISLPGGVLKGDTILDGNYVVVGAIMMHGNRVVQASPNFGYHKGSQHQQITEFPYKNFVKYFKPIKPIKQKKSSTRRSTRHSTRSPTNRSTRRSTRR